MGKGRHGSSERKHPDPAEDLDQARQRKVEAAKGMRLSSTHSEEWRGG